MVQETQENLRSLWAFFSGEELPEEFEELNLYEWDICLEGCCHNKGDLLIFCSIEYYDEEKSFPCSIEVLIPVEFLGKPLADREYSL